MAQYLLSDLAQDDVRQIIGHVRSASPQAARRVVRRLREAMRLVADFPGLGHLREDLADEPLRIWSVYSYLIVYRDAVRPIQIVRVLHGARDVAAILRPGR